jgi:hypothetical protein
MAQVKTKQGYVLESVIINSSRMLEPVDIVGLVSDIEIFEHLDLPYITGQIAFLDTFRLYDRIDFQGAEYCTLKLKNTQSDEVVEQRFVIDKLLSNKKANEQSDLIMFHMIEDIVFKSNLINVNKCYKGSPDVIITKIAQEWLDKDVENLCSDVFQGKLKVIVPNMSPIEAMTWIKNRGTTSDGFPTYLFSSFNLDTLVYADLKTMIERPPINKRAPFIYGPTSHDLEVNLATRLVPIKEYSIEHTDDLYNLIADGLISGEHHFIDTFGFKDKKNTFDIHNDVLKTLIETKNRNQIVSLADDFEIDEQKIQKYVSKQITQISESGAYQDGTNTYLSYDEDHALGHKKKVISMALKKLLLKAPITIRIDGTGFLEPSGHYTTGNIVRILFTANRPSSMGDIKLDLKKSGDYLVYGAKHAFSGARYNIHLKCVKITNYTDDQPLKVIG